MNLFELSSKFLLQLEKKIFRNKKSMFCCLVFLTICLSLVMAFVRHGTSNKWFLFGNENDTFMDFFNSIYDSKFSNPYTERGVIYPPLTYVIYRFFGHMIPEEVYESGSIALRVHQAGFMSFTAYIVISMSILVFALYVFTRKWDQNSSIVIVAVLLSSPMLYSFERGNLISLASAMILIFLALYDSDDMYLREIALFALAVAANIKIFPAVFGLLLIQKMRWKDIVHCFFYAMALFVIPMFWFGGLSNVLVLLRNIFSTSSGFASIHRYRVDIGNVFRVMIEHDIFSTLFSTMEALTLPLGTIVLCTISFMVKEEWKKVLALTLVCVALPGFSWTYNLIYFIPVVLYSIYDNDFSGKSIIYFLLLASMFFYYPFNMMKFLPFSIDNSNYTYRLWDLLSTGGNLALIIMLCLDGILEGCVIGSNRIIFLSVGSNQRNKNNKIIFEKVKEEKMENTYE